MDIFTDTSQHNHIIALGFKRYAIETNNPLYKKADYFYQHKELNYDKKIMYFVDIYVYDWRKWTLEHMPLHIPFSYLIEANLFYNENDNLVLNFSRENTDDIPLVLNKIGEIYEQQKCVINPHNND